MPADDYAFPEAYQAIAKHNFSRAFWLNECVSTLRYEAIHGAPPNLTEEQKSQRKAILGIAEGILARARDREMDEATSRWSTYRTMTK